jgi:hypothetical protein
MSKKWMLQEKILLVKEQPILLYYHMILETIFLSIR